MSKIRISQKVENVLIRQVNKALTKATQEIVNTDEQNRISWSEVHREVIKVVMLYLIEDPL